MQEVTLTSALDQSDENWKNALLFGNKQYFSELAEEITALNEFGEATNTGAIGSAVIAEVFSKQKLSPIDAGRLVNHPSYDAFIGDMLFALGAGSAVLGYDTRKPVLEMEPSAAGGAIAAMVGRAAKEAARSPLPKLEAETKEDYLADSIRDDKGREWTALDVIEDMIDDVSERLFKRPDLARSLKVILQQESPRRQMDGYTYVQTNAVGPANGKHPRGLYQFKQEAWAEAGKVKLSTGQTVAQVIGSYDNAFDPMTNIIASAALIVRNEQIARAPKVALESYLPRGKSLRDPAVAYLMHNQGVGGAKSLLKAGAASVNSKLKYESVKARELIATIFEGV